MFCFYLSVITVLIGSPFLKVGMWAIGQFTGGGGGVAQTDIKMLLLKEVHSI